MLFMHILIQKCGLSQKGFNHLNELSSPDLNSSEGVVLLHFHQGLSLLDSVVALGRLQINCFNELLIQHRRFEI